VEERSERFGRGRRGREPNGTCERTAYEEERQLARRHLENLFIVLTPERREAAAIHEDGAQLNLMLSVRGFSYTDLAADAPTFTVAGSQVRVGPLEKLLRSKELSDRPKDREFLRHFESRLAEDDDTR
jgi:hypothetical protein